MKKLTELDLQTALDECTEKRFRSHGAWLAGMVKRLNEGLGGKPAKLPGPELKPRARQQEVKPIHFFEDALRYPTSTTVIKTGNSTEPEVPCVS